MSLDAGPLAAVQAPRISLDMQPGGNMYDESTNAMAVGAIDNCLTSASANNAQHLHTAHLVIQNVEDLVGWQVRMNYDGARMRPSTVNFTPFTDNTTGQNVSFLNLPLENGIHRDLVTATTIPPQAAWFQTALIGAVYNGEQTLAISPDTPAKSSPDDSSYTAPNGGTLAAVNLQVLAGQAGMPSIYVDLDDGDPNGPGSDLVVFTGTGTTTAAVAESDLGDGFHGEGLPCLAAGPPPAIALPPPPVPPPAEAGDSPAPPDADNDGFSDTVEPSARTDPMRPCGIEAWPADIDNDGISDTRDISYMTLYFGKTVPPIHPRYSIAPDPPDGDIDTADIARLTGVFGRTCRGPDPLPTPGECADETHRWVAAQSGTGNTVQGTRVWTFTVPPGGWSVEKPQSFWGEQAWIIDQATGRGLEVGFYSGYFTKGVYPFTDDLLPYWFIEANNPDESKRTGAG